MKTIGKTPYEIRLDVLELARNILQSQHDARAVLSAGKTAPTTAEVIAEAHILNAFISNAS